MIRFNSLAITFETVQLKSVSTAIGGSITYLDENQQSIRLSVPHSVARSFTQSHKVTKYLKPAPTCIVRYGDHVIGLERHPLASLGKHVDDGVFGEVVWQSECSKNFTKMVMPIISARPWEWYFDGRFIYKLTNDNRKLAINEGVSITSDNHFRKLTAMCFDLQYLNDEKWMILQERSCLAFVASDGEYAISPPIWKNLSTIGALDSKDNDGSIDDEYDDHGDVEHIKPEATLDNLDQRFCMNINFALKAGRELGKLFGFESVEPLQLPRLMIELHTVNLPNVPKQVKATYDIGFNPSHALAWILGLSRNATDLPTLLVVRSLLKYATSKGMFSRNLFDPAKVFVGSASVHDVPLLDITLLRQQKEISIDG